MAKQKCEEHEKQNGYPIGCKKGSDPLLSHLISHQT